MTEKNEKLIPAGDFYPWLNRRRRAQILHEGMEVPCGDCKACCKSSYFIRIKSDEIETLSMIPKELLFEAPGLPKGNVLMGYDEKGHCPMFFDNECSIYEHRPQTCRDYDCRMFPATGLSEGQRKPLISKQSIRWRFNSPTARDKKHISAVKKAASFLIDYADFFPDAFVPPTPTRQAVLALKVYEVLLKVTNDSLETLNEQQVQEIANSILEIYEMFNTGNA